MLVEWCTEWSHCCNLPLKPSVGTPSPPAPLRWRQGVPVDPATIPTSRKKCSAKTRLGSCWYLLSFRFLPIFHFLAAHQRLCDPPNGSSYWTFIHHTYWWVVSNHFEPFWSILNILVNFYTPKMMGNKTCLKDFRSTNQYTNFRDIRVLNLDSWSTVLELAHVLQIAIITVRLSAYVFQKQALKSSIKKKKKLMRLKPLNHIHQSWKHWQPKDFGTDCKLQELSLTQGCSDSQQKLQILVWNVWTKDLIWFNWFLFWHNIYFTWTKNIVFLENIAIPPFLFYALALALRGSFAWLIGMVFSWQLIGTWATFRSVNPWPWNQQQQVWMFWWHIMGCYAVYLTTDTVPTIYQ